MLTLIAAVILGLVFAYIAVQNTTGVPIRIGVYEWINIPLYIIAIGSLLFGLFISWLLSLVDWIASALTISGKDNALHKAERTIENLDRKIHELELENARLRGEKKEAQVREHVAYTRPPTFFERLRHGLSL